MVPDLLLYLPFYFLQSLSSCFTLSFQEFLAKCFLDLTIHRQACEPQAHCRSSPQWRHCGAAVPDHASRCVPFGGRIPVCSSHLHVPRGEPSIWYHLLSTNLLFFSTKCTTLGGILKGLHSTTTIPHRDSEHFQPAQKTSSCPLSHSPNPTHSGSNHCSFITEHGFPLFCQENASVRTLTVGIDLQPILLGSEISHLLCGRTHFLLAAPSSDWVW